MDTDPDPFLLRRLDDYVVLQCLEFADAQSLVHFGRTSRAGRGWVHAFDFLERCVASTEHHLFGDTPTYTRPGSVNLLQYLHYLQCLIGNACHRFRTVDCGPRFITVCNRDGTVQFRHHGAAELDEQPEEADDRVLEAPSSPVLGGSLPTRDSLRPGPPAPPSSLNLSHVIPTEAPSPQTETGDSNGAVQDPRSQRNRRNSFQLIRNFVVKEPRSQVRCVGESFVVMYTTGGSCMLLNPDTGRHFPFVSKGSSSRLEGSAARREQAPVTSETPPPPTTETPPTTNGATQAHDTDAQASPESEQMDPEADVPENLASELPVFRNVRTTFVLQVALGDDHIAVLVAGGKLYTAGDGLFGQLGIGKVDRSFPFLSQVKGDLQERHCVQVACGSNHTMALTSSGRCYTFGQGTHGCLGLGRPGHDVSEPQEVLFCEERRDQSARITAIACGDQHSLVIDAQARAWSFGAGVTGKLGHGDEEDQFLPKKIDALSADHICQVSCGEFHSMVLTDDGICKAFGWNSHGQCALESGQQRAMVPNAVKPLHGAIVKEISCGNCTSSIITDTDEVYIFGEGCEDGGYDRLWTELV